jgi:hypothetical protein
MRQRGDFANVGHATTRLRSGSMRANREFRIESVAVDSKLVDRMVDAYVAWREARGAVWEAYTSWTAGPACSDSGAFLDYCWALDREEDAAGMYQSLLMEISYGLRFRMAAAGS